MKYITSSAVAICLGIAMGWLVGCAPTTHVTETTTTREYDTTNPPVYISGAGCECEHDHDHPI